MSYYATPGREVVVHHGRAEDVLPALDLAGVRSVVTDPPYGETCAAWDVWPDGWPTLLGEAAGPSASMWCFGSARMFLDRRDDFTEWRFTGQEVLWVKRNGTGPGSRDRTVKVHEWAYQWVRGPWRDLHHEWPRTKSLGTDKGYVRKQARQAPHQRPGRESAWTDDGTRQPLSVRWLPDGPAPAVHVVESPSVRGRARHQDEKPLVVVTDLVRECTPTGGTVLDLFAGSGTTGVAALMLGRRAVLIDADEGMCEVAARRLEESVSGCIGLDFG